MLAFAAWTAIMVPPVYLSRFGRPNFNERATIFYWRWANRLIGMRTQVHGTPITERPALFVANHSSYLDVPVLGALVGGCFVAKREVLGWPVLGKMSLLQRTVFIERNPRRSIDERDDLSDRLANGERLILFPEGTSNDGNRVLPFKSALFNVAERTFDGANGADLKVQPVSVAYVGLDGTPLGRHLRPLLAWYGDMTLAPHFWTALGLGQLTIDVRFHDPVTISDYGDRKALAEACWRSVSSGVADALRGRSP